MELNKENMKKIRWLIVFTVAVVVAGVNYQKILGILGTLFGFVFPFLLGAVIAFVLNVPMRFIEKHLPLKEKNRMKRPLSLVLTLVFVIGVLMVVILVVVPQLLETIMNLQRNIPPFLDSVKRAAESLFADNPGIVEDINSIQVDWQSILEGITGFLSTGASTVFSSTISVAKSLVSGVTTFAIGFVFSLYVLLQKENLGRQFKKLMRAYLPSGVYDSVLSVLGLASKTFSSFLAGQCVEAVILGSMFFLTLSVFRLPYAMLIGVLIAFTALIPVFGAFIGCAVGAFLMLVESPVDALVFVVIFLILQQIEGNLIYPHVVGGSVGLPSIWVLMAVTVGGSAMGITGMLVFIPLCSVLYALLRGAVNERLKKRMPDKKPAKPGAGVQKTEARKQPKA